MGYFYLTIAIVCEVIATSSLKASAQFTRIGPSVIVVLGYAASFYFLSLVLKVIPVGIAYAVWSGLGIVLVTVAAIVLFKQVPDLPAVIGMILIICGVAVMNLFSKTMLH